MNVGFRRFLIIMILICSLVGAQSVFAAEEDSILLSSAEDLYALGRLLSTAAAKSAYMQGHYNLTSDLARFPIPEDLTDAGKLQYLAGANYRLTEDIQLTFSKGTDYFMGIGSSENRFSGSFDGGGHKISVSAKEEIYLDSKVGTALALFPVVSNGIIQNLDVHVTGDVRITKTSGNINMGVLVGAATGVSIDQCNVKVTDAIFGVDTADSNAKRSYIWVGGLAGKLDGATVTDCQVLLENAGLVAGEQEDSQLTQIELGGFVGRIRSDNSPSSVTGCNFRGVDARITNTVSNIGMTAAYAGNAAKTTFRDCHIALQDTRIESVGRAVNATSMYSIVSTGGMIGFSQAGSNNTDRIGYVGNQITGCTLTATNRIWQDVILSTAETGSELTAGGLVGCTFNNLLIENSTVSVARGNIAAIKSGSTDTASTYGTQAGGIIGRMEHTGQLVQCRVYGQYCNIVSKSPNNQSNAGGIVGIDLGPYHKDATSIRECTFDGTNTSHILVHITTQENAKKKPVAAGGIAGTGTYRIESCTASGVAVACAAPQITNPCYIGEIAGYYISNAGWWKTGAYFTPRLPEIVNCTAEQVRLLQISGQVENGYTDNGNGTHNYICGICGTVEIEDEAHTFTGGKCECGAEEPVAEEIFKGISRAKSLSVKDVIYMKATVAFVNADGTANAAEFDKDYALANGKILFWSEKTAPVDGVFTIENATAVQALADNGVYDDGIQEYYAYSHGIAAAEYGDTIYFCTYIVVDGVEYYGEMNQYSVVTYANNQFAKTNTKLKTMLAGMLNYGAAAQVQFGYKTDALANASLQTAVEKGQLSASDLELNWSDDLLHDPTDASEEMAANFAQNNAKRTAASLVLQSMVQPKVTFAYNIVSNKGTQLPEGGTVTVYYWSGADYAALAANGTALTAANASYVIENENITESSSDKYGYEYAAYLEGIPAKELGDAFYVAAVFELADGTEYCSGVSAYSPEIYAANQLKKTATNEVTRNLLQWMVVYGERAEAYYASLG